MKLLQYVHTVLQKQNLHRISFCVFVDSEVKRFTFIFSTDNYISMEFCVKGEVTVPNFE